MESGKYYVLSAGNNLTESMTKEQILSAITQAVESHTISDVDTGFVEKVKEQNSAANLKFWVGTTAQYNALATKENGCFYILTDDTQFEDMEAEIDDLNAFKTANIDYIIEKGSVAGETNLYYEKYSSGKYVIYGQVVCENIGSYAYALQKSITTTNISWLSVTATPEPYTNAPEELSVNAKALGHADGIYVYVHDPLNSFTSESTWNVFIYAVGQIV